jgi:hypothetical protein
LRGFGNMSVSARLTYFHESKNLSLSANRVL